MKTRALLDTLYRWISKRPVYHGLFWMALFVLMLGYHVDDYPWKSLTHLLSYQLISFGFYSILVYFNLYFLIPEYLARRAFVYLGWVIVTCAVVTPIMVLVFYLLWPSMRPVLVPGQLSFIIRNVGITLLSTVLRVIMDWWRYQGEKQTLLTQNMQSELRFLKSQINPHFLFNTLNNLYALTLRKSDQAPEIVLKLSEIMRYMLYECNEKRVLLTKEVQYIHNYLDLERLRQPKAADIQFITQGFISDQLVAPLLFVPFLENSFKHGLNHHVQGGGFVRLQMEVSGTDLLFFIENSKPDQLPRQEHPRSGGIGLTNVRQRLDLLYPDAHDLTIEDAPNCYTVTLHLKLI
jgi:two-component system, LytTR family, sensor kinase